MLQLPRAPPHLLPVRIRAGAFGADLSKTDLLVSPQHRVLMRSGIARRMSGSAEMLVTAKQLLMLDGIAIADDPQDTARFHALFDRHEVVISNGPGIESLYAGPEAPQSPSRTRMEEILALPTASGQSDRRPGPARVTPGGRKARRLAMWHMRHRRPLVAQAPA